MKTKKDLMSTEESLRLAVKWYNLNKSTEIYCELKKSFSKEKKQKLCIEFVSVAITDTILDNHFDDQVAIVKYIMEDIEDDGFKNRLINSVIEHEVKQDNFLECRSNLVMSPLSKIEMSLLQKRYTVFFLVATEENTDEGNITHDEHERNQSFGYYSKDGSKASQTKGGSTPVGNIHSPSYDSSA